MQAGRIDSSVTVLGNIKRACQSSIDKYDNCLSENKSNPMACLDLVREVFQPLAYDWYMLVDYMRRRCGQGGGNCPSSTATEMIPGFGLHIGANISIVQEMFYDLLHDLRSSSWSDSSFGKTRNDKFIDPTSELRPHCVVHATSHFSRCSSSCDYRFVAGFFRSVRTLWVDMGHWYRFSSSGQEEYTGWLEQIGKLKTSKVLCVLSVECRHLFTNVWWLEWPHCLILHPSPHYQRSKVIWPPRQALTPTKW